MLFSGTPAPAADEAFEAASIKPNVSGSDSVVIRFAGRRFTANSVSLGVLMAVAYDVQDFQISGLPNWAWSEKYDVTATAAGSPNPEQFRAMLQILLTERFQLRLHQETRPAKGYALVQDKRGTKALKVHDKLCGPDSGKGGSVCGGFVINSASLDGIRVSMKQLASALAQQRDVGRPVADKTGITGTFDLQLRWSTAAGDEGLSVFTALQEQLGLRLDADTVETKVLSVDRVERPSAN
jgi:uncharacterized protein (TIGR03435 family)